MNKKCFSSGIIRSMCAMFTLLLLMFCTIVRAQNVKPETPALIADTTKSIQPAPRRRGTSQGVPAARLSYESGKTPAFWSVATAETIMERYPDYRQAYWKDWTYVQGYMFHGFEILYRATGDRRYLDYI